MQFNWDSYKLAAFELAKQTPFYVAEGIFQFGSTVYRNKKPDDIDVIVVYSGSQHTEAKQVNSGEYTLNAYHISTFTEMLNNHKIDALECLFLPKTANKFVSPILQNIFDNFKLDKDVLRRSISSTSSNSYAKAKKKLIVQDDYDLECSIKSLWHSFRIMDFGIQLAETSCINDFKSKNPLFVEIINKYIETKFNWEEIHKFFKPQMNELHSKFKLLCPLEEN